MINIPLRILLVEDNETDVLLTRRTLNKLIEEPEIEVAEDLSGCKDKLINFLPDVIISDYNLPTCTGLDILELAYEKDPELPVIFLTGTIHDEELASNTVLAGATGFILKKHMNNLEEKLKPLLKKVVFAIVGKNDFRERLRENKIALNQIYDYLDHLKADNIEQKENLVKLKDSIRNQKIGKDEDDKTT